MQTNKKPFSRVNGFTLSEVLIALALLGIIAAFSIPKVMQSVQNAERNAKMKETVASLYQIMEEGRLQGTLTPANQTSYFQSKLNAVKQCDNGRAEGCYGATLPTYGTLEFDVAASVLHNGTLITGFNDCCGAAPFDNGGWSHFSANEYADGILIDFNGDKEPNVWGEDQLRLSLCYGNVDCGINSLARPACSESDASAPAPTRQKAGTIAAFQRANWCGMEPALIEKNVALYDAIFSQ